MGRTRVPTLRCSQPTWYFVWATSCLCLLGACAPRATPPAPDPELLAIEERKPAHDRDRVGPLGIPEGDLPKAGECRVWYPGGPASQQLSPRPCDEAESHAAPGTLVLYRPPDDNRVVHARVTDPERTGRIIRINLYDAERGTYLGTKEVDDRTPEERP
jgi:hypothetical protein